jgi:osmotically-inducible protein OsmY
MAEPQRDAYLVEHIREHLLRDPRVGELDIHVAIEGDRVSITGHVSTQERRTAISEVLTALLPDCDIRNETIVSVYPEAPESALP